MASSNTVPECTWGQRTRACHNTGVPWGCIVMGGVICTSSLPPQLQPGARGSRHCRTQLIDIARVSTATFPLPPLKKRVWTSVPHTTQATSTLPLGETGRATLQPGTAKFILTCLTLLHQSEVQLLSNCYLTRRTK